MWQSTPPEVRDKAPDFEALDFEPGTLIGTQYRIERKLGGGGMGVVYKCHDIALQRTVAIKFLQPHLAGTHRGLVRLQQEARALSKLTDPSIIKVHHLSRSADSVPPYLVMDFLEGRSLAEVIKAEHTLDIDRCLRIMIEIADGLSHAHRLGIVHRDLKPANIMLVLQNGRETAKILDFGMAKILYALDQPEPNLTRTGEIFGTPAYMSPEQALGKTVDDRTDQYSLGCMLFECLTGTTPHVGGTAMETMIRHVTEEVDPLSQASLGKRFSPRLEALVHRLLCKDPSRRFRNMGEVRDELHMILNKVPGYSETAADTPAAERREGARKIHLMLMAIVVGILFGITAGAYFVQPQKQVQLAAEKKQRAASVEPIPVTLKMLIRGELHDVPDSSDPDFSEAAKEFLRYTEKHTYAENVCLHNERFSYLSDQGLAAIERMPNVRCLDLTKCEYIGDDGLKHLLKFKLLTLDLTRTNVTDGALITLRPMKSLVSLAFTEDSGITNRGMKELQYFPRLARIDLEKTGVDANGLADIAKCKSLRILELQHLRISNGLAALQALPDLQDLDLSGTDIVDKDLEALVPIKSLRKVAIKSTAITAGGLETLKRMRQLKQISLLDALRLNKTEIDDLKRAMPKCHIRCDADDPD
jgi:hypothetical protein